MDGMIAPALARALTKREAGVTVTAVVPADGEVALVQVGEVACQFCDDEDRLFRRATQAQRRAYGLDPDDGRRAFVCDACGEVVIDDDVAYADCETILIGVVPGGEAARNAMADTMDEVPAWARFRIYQLNEADCCGRSAFRAPREGDDAADDEEAGLEADYVCAACGEGHLVENLADTDASGAQIGLRFVPVRGVA